MLAKRLSNHVQQNRMTGPNTSTIKDLSIASTTIKNLHLIMKRGRQCLSTFGNRKSLSTQYSVYKHRSLGFGLSSVYAEPSANQWLQDRTCKGTSIGFFPNGLIVRGLNSKTYRFEFVESSSRSAFSRQTMKLLTIGLLAATALQRRVERQILIEESSNLSGERVRGSEVAHV